MEQYQTKNIKNEIQQKINLADSYLNSEYYKDAAQKTKVEELKTPLRTDIINYLIQTLKRPIKYLEIGVRNPDDNFNKIISENKYSVDPGYENVENNVDFKMTSDEFFENLRAGNVLKKDMLFDVIFIDGLHLAVQVEKDIQNSFAFLAQDGFIIMHDCNPPTQFHAAEDFAFKLSPSKNYWNGTTWKSFFKNRKRTDIFSCCIDTDWGVGIISRSKNLGAPSTINNEFFEYKILDENRVDSLNLISFEQLKKIC